MNASDVNNELLIGFIDESIDSLIAVDSLFVQLEAAPADIDLVNSIFRPIHSLKGNAAYFGLMKIKKLSHTMENLLDKIRKGQSRADRTSIDSLLPGVDCLRSMLSNVRNGEEEISDEQPLSAILAHLENVLGTAAMPSSKDAISTISELLGEIRKNMSGTSVSAVDNLVKALASVPGLSALGTATAKSEAVSEGKQPLKGAAGKLHEILTSNKSLRKNKDLTALVGELITTMRDEHKQGLAARAVEEIFDIYETFTHTESGIDELAISMMQEKLPACVSDTNQQTASNASEPQKNKAETKVKHDKTMRIPEQSLDDFLRCVGELLGVEEMLRNLMRLSNAGAEENIIAANLKDAVTQFEGISKELRTKIMEVRKVEAGILLQKTPRIVRDISTQSGKKINVECIGTELHIDKSYIDLLDAPLTHMVRNAADHGIELPQVRTDAGKNDTGTVTVTLQENGNDLQLIITDDGAGLNYEGLQKKAVGLGIVAANTQLSKSQIVDLLFMSGVSTATVVTDVSGRGVGMDVVKRAIDSAGGKIDVVSVPGKGTTFTVSVPRNASTQILDGYSVRSFSGDVYVLPIDCVVEAFNISPNEVSTVTGKGKIISRRNLVFAVYTLDNLLGIPAESQDITMGVLIEFKGKKAVIAVKEIMGIQKVVCKPVEGNVLDNELYEGAAISGTGYVSMIVNMENLLDI